jgi:hypothetical protein
LIHCLSLCYEFLTHDVKIQYPNHSGIFSVFELQKTLKFFSSVCRFHFRNKFYQVVGVHCSFNALDTSSLPSEICCQVSSTVHQRFRGTQSHLPCFPSLLLPSIQYSTPALQRNTEPSSVLPLPSIAKYPVQFTSASEEHRAIFRASLPFYCQLSSTVHQRFRGTQSHLPCFPSLLLPSL